MTGLPPDDPFAGFPPERLIEWDGVEEPGFPEHVIICRRTDELHDPVAGAKPVACARCATSIWAAPRSQTVLERDDVVAMCLRCACEIGGLPDDEIERIEGLLGEGA